MNKEIVPNNVLITVVVVSAICALTFLCLKGCSNYELRQKSIDIREKQMIEQGYTYEYNEINGKERWYKPDGTTPRAEYTP